MVSKSSESSGGDEGSRPLISPSFTERLKTMVRHVAKILKKCAVKKGQQSLTTEAAESQITLDNLPVEDPMLVGTVVPSLDETETESPKSFVDKVTEAIKIIVQERAKIIKPIDYFVQVSEKDGDMFELESSYDMAEVASAIVVEIIEELKLNSEVSLPDSLAIPEKTSHWKTVAAKLKDFYAQRFAMGSLLGLMAKLRRKYKCVPEEQSSLSQLMEEADDVVRSIISSTEEDLRKMRTDETPDEIINSVGSDQDNTAAIELGDLVFEHLQPEAPTVDFRLQIQGEVETFMGQIRRWLNLQLIRHQRKKDHVSLVLKKIREVVCQTSPTETPSVIGSGCVTPVGSCCVTPVEVETKPPSTPIRSIKSPVGAKTGDTLVVEVESPSTPVRSVKKSPVGAKTGDTLEAKPPSTPVRSVKSLVVAKTGDTLVVEVESPSTPVRSVKISPVGAKTGDTLVAKLPSTSIQSTKSPVSHEAAVETAAPAAHQWDDTRCRLMVIALVRKILKSPIHLDIHVTCSDIEAVSRSLAETFLEQITGSEFAVKPSGQHIKKVAKAVHKELCKLTGDAEILKMCLLSRDASVYRCITEALTKHLVKPQKKTGVNRLFSRLFKTVAKPFAACFGLKE
ncbi:uncharacterized protein LOC127352445 [Dicentrarchus labrax]|uniref:uncharacterized protein LOC127352445 n=1 Tax=Dicentrarchus labrax TaxID=13489 RepID=UPI0021F5490C|nr:uncharacterized protein LOC127352445 [Dicentrarchus labrax]